MYPTLPSVPRQTASFVWYCPPSVSTTNLCYTTMSLPCGAISQAFSLHIFILKQPSSTISVFQSKAGYTLKSLSLLKTCTCSRGSKILHGTYTCVVLTKLYLHVYFLHCSGVVHTCGLNDAHQLGLGTNPSSAPTNCLTPKPVSSRSSC